MKLIRNKKFYMTLLAIILPIAFQNVLSVTVNLVDTIMVGKLGEASIAGVSIAGQPFFLFNIITFGLASGAGVLISQYWGKGQVEPIKKILAFVLQLAIVLALIFFLLNIAIPEKLAGLYLKKSDANSPAAIAEAVAYMRILSISYLFYALTNTTYMIMRSVEKVKIALFSNIVAICINVIFNYLLIFGKFGFPKMGIRGAAIATVLARGVEFLIMLIYMSFVDKTLKFNFFKDFFKFDKKLAKSYFKYATPVVINETIWALGATVIALILGKISANTLTAYSIVQIVYQMSTVFMFGLGSAAAVVVGKAIGEKASEAHIKDISLTLQLVAFIVAIIAFALIMILRKPILSIYTLTPETYKIASDMMTVFAIISIFVSFSITNMIGILRGGGDTKAVMIMDIVFLYLISIPLGALSGLVFGWPIFVTFFILKSDEILKFFLGTLRVFCHKWIKDVTVKSETTVNIEASYTLLEKIDIEPNINIKLDEKKDK